MNTALQTFQFHSQQLTAIQDENGSPWFIAKEACDILLISNTSQAVSRLDDDEKLIYTLYISGQNREVLLINESGLYSLILTSQKPEAKVFKKWVTSEVLPAIRKTGAYSTPTANTINLPIQEYADLLKALVGAQDRLLALPSPNKVGKWEAAEVSLLEARRAAGIGVRPIARELNRSFDSVKQKIHSLKQWSAVAVQA